MSEDESYAISGLPASMSYPLSRPQLFAAALKRRASPSFEGLQEDSSRKRKKEVADDDAGAEDETVSSNAVVMNSSLADDLAQELQCPCCSELVYRPVIVAPCQHFFCGR
jgi:E3 ubiquitin-protein ligase CHFR